MSVPRLMSADSLMRHYVRGRGSQLLVSSDFEEVASACHRVLIFDRGRVVAELGRSDLSVARITAMASGSDKVGNEGGQFELAHV